MKLGRAIFNWNWVTFPISKNKSFEFQLELGRKFADQPFEFSINWTNKGDHAGFTFTFAIYKLFWASFLIHDNRHWNYEENRWYKYGEAEEKLENLSKI